MIDSDSKNLNVQASIKGLNHEPIEGEHPGYKNLTENLSPLATEALKELMSHRGAPEMLDWENMKSTGTITLSVEGSLNFMEALGYPTGFEDIDEEVGSQEGLDEYIKERRHTLLAQ